MMAFSVTFLQSSHLNAIPALLDIKFNANIVVVSLMLNSMLVFFAIWVLKYKMRDPSIGSLGSYLLPDNVLLPQWISWSAAVRDRIPRQVLCCCEASDQEADLYTFSDIVRSYSSGSRPDPGFRDMLLLPVLPGIHSDRQGSGRGC